MLLLINGLNEAERITRTSQILPVDHTVREDDTASCIVEIAQTLLVTQCFNRVELGCPTGGIVAKEDPDQSGEAEGDQDRFG